MTRYSIIMPTLNEGERIASALELLAPLRAMSAQIVVVDGGSVDKTVALAQPLADVVVKSPPGRAIQMNAGAQVASGEVFIFLHADTQLPPQALSLIARRLDGVRHQWGRFDVVIAGRSRFLPVVAWMMNQRSRLTGICTGDQAIFMTRAAFERVGGFPAIALMEDIAMSRMLKKLSPPLCLSVRAVTSGRRWENNGVARTIMLMWTLRLLYFLGVDPRWLARLYGYGKAS